MGNLLGICLLALFGLFTISPEKGMDFTISTSVVQDYVSISGDQIEEVFIYNQAGKIILKSDGGAIFDMSTFADGIYLVQVNTGKNSSAKRIMKI